MFLRWQLGLATIIVVSLVEIAYVIYLLQATAKININLMIAVILLFLIAMSSIYSLDLYSKQSHNVELVAEPLNYIPFVLMIAPLGAFSFYCSDIYFGHRYISNGQVNKKYATIAILTILALSIICILYSTIVWYL